MPFSGPSFIDGYLGEAREIAVVQPPTFPFLSAQTPDAYARRIPRAYEQDPAVYTPRLHERTSISSGISYTEDFSTGAWTKTNLTHSANQVANPANGLVTVSKLLETSATGAHSLSRAHTFASAESHVLPFFAKWEGRDWIRILCNDGTEDYEGFFNLRDGTTKPFADILNSAIRNGSFETSGSPFGTWTAVATGSSTVTRDTSVSYAGAASCKFALDGSANYTAIQQSTLLEVGRRYRLSFVARNSGAGTVLPYCGGQLLSPALTEAFAQYSLDFDALSADLFFFCQDTPAAIVYLDSVVVTPLSLSPVLSTAVRNGGFETAGSPFGTWSAAANGSSTVTRDTSVYHEGSASCKFALDGSANFAYIQQSSLLQVGRRYRLSFMARNSGAGTVLPYCGGQLMQPALTAAFASYAIEFTALSADLFFFCQDTPSSVVYLDAVAVAPINLPSLILQRQPAPGDSIFRCSMVFTPRAAAGTVSFDLTSDGSTLSYAGDTAKGVYLWGINLRPGTEPGPYVSAIGTARTIDAPDIDPEDCFAWQVAESDLDERNSARALFSRAFARLPANQSRWGSVSFLRPSYHGLKSGLTNFAVTVDDGDSTHIFASRKVVSAAATVPGDVVTGAMPSGNITLTDSAGHTAVFAANASQATIQAALTALAAYGVITVPSCAALPGRVTVSWNNGTGTMVSYGTLPSGVMLGSGSAGQHWWSFVSTATTTTPDTRRLSVTSHGAVAGDRVALWNGDTLIGVGDVGTVIDANTLSVLCSALSQPDALITTCGFSSQASVRYANGARKINCLFIREFYLPGVSMVAGSTLASVGDLTPVAVYTSGQGWFNQIVAGTALIPIDASDLEVWEGPIMSREVTYVRAADALESIPV